MAGPVTRLREWRRVAPRRGPEPYPSERQEQRERLGKAMVIALLVLVAILLGMALSRPSAAQAPAPDREAARFAPCTAAKRIDCLVDGDTFWYRAEKIRLADINTPEVSQPACPREAELGAVAARRLTELLNEGPFTLARSPDDSGRDRDRYGRLLRTVTRGGESLGAALVREGLAEDWQGRRGSWCPTDVRS